MTSSSRSAVKHVDAEARRDQISLLGNFYNSARQELIERIGHRDRSMVLFLGTSAAIATVAFTKISTSKGSHAQGGLLLVITLLGVGAALVYDWHNQVIGRLGAYLGTEFQDEVRFAFTGSRRLATAAVEDAALYHWDASFEVVALGQRSRSRTYIPVGLIVTPQLLAGITGVALLPDLPSRILAGIGVLAMTLPTLLVLLRSARRRTASSAKVTTRTPSTASQHTQGPVSASGLEAAAE